MWLCAIVHFQVLTKKRNQLEHERLNKLVYVSYNRKMENRFRTIRELGSKGKRSNPLVMKSLCRKMNGLKKNNEADGDSSIWHAVDEALGATQVLQDRNLPRLAVAGAASSSRPQRTYVRTRKRSRNAATQDIGEDDSDAQEDGNATTDAEEQQEQPLEATRYMDQDESESGGGKAAADAFCLDVDLL
jgi:hypothetical protein